MSEARDPHKAVDYIITNAGKYAKAKAERVYLEEFRKSKKALLMGQCFENTSAAREQFAYAHKEYLAVLEGLKAAVELEEEIRWGMIAAQTRVDVWRTEQASNRNQERATR